VDISADESTGPKNTKMYTKKPTMFKNFKLGKHKPIIEQIHLGEKQPEKRVGSCFNGEISEIEAELPDMIKIFEVFSFVYAQVHGKKVVNHNKSLPLDDSGLE
jgi:hypothetical protein